MSRRLATACPSTTIVVAALLVMAAAACGGGENDPKPGWAIVKVEIADDGAALEAICIGLECRLFEPTDNVRGAEFSAFVAPGEEIQVRRVGDDDNASATAPAPVGGCVLVRIGDSGTAFDVGCRAANPSGT